MMTTIKKTKKLQKRTVYKPVQKKPARITAAVSVPEQTKPASGKKFYVSNKEFFKELMVCQKKHVMSNELGKIFIMLCNRYSSKYNFQGYSYRDELVQSGILACCTAYMKFNRKKGSNCFAFFTSVIHNAFIAKLNSEKKFQRIRDRLLVEMAMEPSASYTEFLDEEERTALSETRLIKENSNIKLSMEEDHVPDGPEKFD